MDARTAARTETQVSESNFISKVYLWMSLGLGLSALGALWLLAQPALLKTIFTNNLLFIGIIVAELALVVWLSAAALRMSVGLATLLFCAYSLLNGVTLTSVFLIYTGVSVLSTFFITAGTFLFFSVYGLTTRRDLTSIGGLLTMGLFGVIIASVVNFFLKSPAVMWITTFVGIAVFLGLIAYDTQKLKSIHAMGFETAEVQRKSAILGALVLYLDFINLFLLLLRLFGRRRD
ncbi:MAG: Bax inhibitor-1/YccA family protein [Candidatus Omnitrophica bacterium]|nr:Bax inhibitor-1/YccA family protein [Candidatus Omnitrophota bacterium]